MYLYSAYYRFCFVLFTNYLFTIKKNYSKIITWSCHIIYHLIYDIWYILTTNTNQVHVVISASLIIRFIFYIIHYVSINLTNYMVLFYSWPAVAIHGDKSQQDRDWVLNGKSFICAYLYSRIF